MLLPVCPAGSWVSHSCQVREWLLAEEQCKCQVWYITIIPRTQEVGTDGRMKSWIQAILSYSESKALSGPGREILTDLAGWPPWPLLPQSLLEGVATGKCPGTRHSHCSEHLLFCSHGFFGVRLRSTEAWLHIDQGLQNHRDKLTGIRSSPTARRAQQRTARPGHQCREYSRDLRGHWLTLELQLKSSSLTSCLHLFCIISVLWYIFLSLSFQPCILKECLKGFRRTVHLKGGPERGRTQHEATPSVYEVLGQVLERWLSHQVSSFRGTQHPCQVLSTTCNSSFSASNSLGDLGWKLHTCDIHSQRCTHIHIMQYIYSYMPSGSLD